MVVNKHRASLHPMMQTYLKQQDHMPINGLDWKLIRGAAVPGPGAHDAHIREGPLNDRLGGGGWNSHTGKVFHADAACKRTGTVPGPGHYVPLQGTFAHERVAGCSMDRAQAKSLTDQIVKRAKQVPAPNCYNMPTPNPLPEGGRISSSITKTFADQVMLTADQSPASNAYLLPEVEPPPNGKFSTGKPKNELDWITQRSRAMPGPNEYTITVAKSKIGGHMRASDRPLGNASIAKLEREKPGPTNYSPLESWKFTKKQGSMAGCSMAGRTGPSFLPPPYQNFGYSNRDDKFASTLKEKRFGPNAPRAKSSLAGTVASPVRYPPRAASEEPMRGKGGFFMTQ